MTTSKTNDRLSGYDRFVRQCMRDWDVPGAAVGIVKGSRTIYAKGFGLRDVRRRLPVTENTLFGIASCTKAFTATAVGILVDEGTLEWDVPVRNYLPEFKMYDPVATQRMTLRDLLTHRSGLPAHNYVWSAPSASRPELLKRLRHLKPNKDFRSTYQYNNLMYMAAGAALERVTGQTWEEFVKERILLPTRMNNSRFWTGGFSEKDGLAIGYLAGQGARPAPRHPGAHNRPYAIAPAGSIVTDVGDMCRWVRLQMAGGGIGNNAVISKHSLNEIHTPQTVFAGEANGPGLLDASYAMGWIVQPYRGHRWIHHYGGFAGFTALTSFMPEESIGVVVLANMFGLPPFATAVSLNAYERLLGLSPARWYVKQKKRAKRGEHQAPKTSHSKRKRCALPSRPLEQYAGEYRDPGYGRLAVSLELGRLVLRYNAMVFSLTHREGDGFDMADRHERKFSVAFNPDKVGKVTSVAIPLEPAVDDIVFKKLSKRTSRR